MYFMGIEKPLGFIPQSVLLLPAVLGDLFHRRRLVDAFAVAENGNKDLPHGVGASRQLCLLPGLDWIEEKKVFVCVVGFSHKADQVSLDLACCFIIDPIDCLVSRIGDLFCIF